MAKDPLIGKTISINLKKGAFLGIGSIWLSHETPHAEVPDDLSPEELDTIRRLLVTGDLFMGKVKTEFVDKDKKVLSKYVQALKEARNCSRDYKMSIVSLIKEGGEGGYKPQDIIAVLLKAETGGRGRKDFVAFLEEALEVAKRRFPEFLERLDSDESAAYDVFIDPETMKVVSATKPQESTEKPKKQTKKATRKRARKKDVDKAFGE